MNNKLSNPSSISSQQLNFVYDNAVNYQKSILDSMKTISNRSMVLLGYLAIIIGFCVKSLLQGHNSHLELAIMIMFILYYIGLFQYVVNFSRPRLGYAAYDEPDHLLDEDIVSQNEHTLKYIVCRTLQKKIDVNRGIMLSMNNKFYFAINLSFLFIPKAIFCLWSLICQYLLWEPGT